MWHWKYTIFIYVLYFHRVPATEDIGCRDYNYNGYTIGYREVGDPPAIPDVHLSDNMSDPTQPPKLWVYLTNRTEDFNFTVFLNPSNCPPSLNKTPDLLQYERTCSMYKDANESKPQTFSPIYIGCYYFIMTNAKGNNWEWGPVPLNSSFGYHDTRLKLVKKNFEALETNFGRRMSAELIIPLSCIKEIRVALYEIDGNVDAVEDIENYRINESQECWIFKNGSNVGKRDCQKSQLVTKLGLEVHLTNDTGKEWTIVFTWTELHPDGGTYYLRFKPNTTVCDHRFGYDNMNKWVPIMGNDLFKLGHYNPVPLPPPPKPGSIYPTLFTISLVCISLGIILTIILVHSRIRNNKLEQNPTEEHICEPICKWPGRLPDEGESNHILLIYARDSPPFMKRMEEFRVGLAKACDCHVFDLYTKEDWKLIVNYGGAQWVADQLRDGCRIIWVDTPRFRSRLNNEQDQYNIGDFRDQIVPYAVKLATGPHLNAATQYTRHFVVHMEGFIVKDKHDDPLHVVVPYTRFHIPRHISYLHHELRDSIKTVGASTCEE